MMMNIKRSSTPCSRDREFPDRIILTGFRATGKSVVGRRLAERIGRRFIDTDSELCGQIKCSIADYVRQQGWPAFRKMERELLAELGQSRKVVIATGGGTILHEEQWAALRKNSLVVWLRADAATIRKRLTKDDASPDQRPSLTGSDASREIDELLVVRTPLYKKGSDVAVNTEGRTPESLASEIAQGLDSQAMK